MPGNQPEIVQVARRNGYVVRGRDGRNDKVSAEAWSARMRRRGGEVPHGVQTAENPGRRCIQRQDALGR